MIAFTTYQDFKGQIEENTTRFTQKLRDEILEETSLQRAIQKARRIARDYSARNTVTQIRGLQQVGITTVNHFLPALSKEEKDLLVENGMNYLINVKYYNLNLNQRLQQSDVVLRANITKSAAVGKNKETKLVNITRVFKDPYPFGAHENWDQRLFLAEVVRLEHHLVQKIAEREGWKYLKWTLSASHSHVDMCDMLANTVDTKVIDALVKDNIDSDGKGVYFKHQVPPIPHPNCQCTLQPIKPKPVKPARRPNLIQRIIKRIFG